MTTSRPRLLLFDPYVGGHHADHVRWLAEGWLQRDIPGALVAAVPERMRQEHPELRALEGRPGGRFRVLPLRHEVRPAASLRAAHANARLLRQAVRQSSPGHVLSLFMDHLQPALASRFPVGGVPVSGILFRPTLHYGLFDQAKPTLARRAARARKALLLRAALHNPLVRSVLTLDPTAVEAMSHLAPGRVTCRWLPDPVDFGRPRDDAQSLRTAYGVEPGRTLMLLFGALDQRKGVLDVLEALRYVAPDAARRIALLLAGRPSAGMGERLEAAVARARDASEAQVITRTVYVPDADVQNLVSAADVVLAPYRQHVGSSGVVMRAAAAGKPVLSQADGLMGWQVRSYRLGVAVDPQRLDALAGALQSLALEPHTHIDLARAREFAAAHTVDAYVDTILSTLKMLPSES